jgi:hypothetical protein
MAKYLAQTGRTLTPANLAAALQERVEKREIAQSTLYGLKSAALLWIGQDAEAKLSSRGEIAEHESSYAAVQAVHGRGLNHRSALTSGSKLKFFPDEAITALDARANASPPAPKGELAADFVHANLLVGLRPGEWLTAAPYSHLVFEEAHEGLKYRLNEAGQVQSVLAMRVENEKATQGRGNGPYRELLLHGISNEDFARILTIADVFHRWRDHFEAGAEERAIAKQLTKGLQKAMALAFRRVGYPKGEGYPTSYSTRHQAIANAKASGLSEREIAAFFGHASVYTAKRHYGKKSRGEGNFRFRASPETVAKVKQTRPSYITPDDRQRLRSLADHSKRDG